MNHLFIALATAVLLSACCPRCIKPETPAPEESQLERIQEMRSHRF